MNKIYIGGKPCECIHCRVKSTPTRDRYIWHYFTLTYIARESFATMILSGFTEKDEDGYVDLNSPTGREYLMKHLFLFIDYDYQQDSCFCAFAIQLI